MIDGAPATSRGAWRRTRRWLLLLALLTGLPNPSLGQEAAGRAQAPLPAHEWMERQVRSVERALHNAHFRSALGISEQLRNHPAATDAQKLRLELTRATAALALGDHAASEESLLRVLRLDPEFVLAESHPPKLRSALAAARAASP